MNNSKFVVHMNLRHALALRSDYHFVSSPPDGGAPLSSMRGVKIVYTSLSLRSLDIVLSNPVQRYGKNSEYDENMKGEKLEGCIFA